MSEKYQLTEPTVSLYAEKMMHKILNDKANFSSFFRHNNWQDDDVASALGFPDELGSNEHLLNSKPDFKKTVKALLKQRFTEIETLSLDDQNLDNQNEFIQQAYRNQQFIADLLELEPVEQEIFRFAFHLKFEPNFLSLLEYTGRKNFSQTLQYLSTLFPFSFSELKMALKKQGKLFQYGFIERCSSPDRIREFLRWGDILNIDDFCTQSLTTEHILQHCTTPTPKARLTWNDFSHIETMRENMFLYLQQVVRKKQKGTNILIYGKPGTGKTELAILLGEKLNIPTYTMAFMDEDEEILEGERRLQNCHLIQKLLDRTQALVIFDEIEDVFSSSFFQLSAAQSHKAWTNHLLENNAVPMIWLSNDVSRIDNAFLRRFDMVFEMPDLPVSHKENLIQKLVGTHLSPDYVQHFAKVRSLSPAILERTFSVVNCLQQENPEQDFALQSMRLFNQTLQVQGNKKIQPLPRHKLTYNLDYVACSTNIHHISEGLKQTKRGRICCYGPPGTGKTAWANWLAEQCGMSVLVKKGSDLLDKYVGGAEKNIADAFETAKNQNMVLVLDEVDTFLFARGEGQRSWEHSLVNEMLTQIENFDGLMVVSTNLMDNLDPAALRRFDLKLNFDYLQLNQRQQLAQEQAQNLGLTLNESELKMLENFTALTPGDFAAVARRHSFAPFEYTADWLQALKEECDLKKIKVTRTMGFL